MIYICLKASLTVMDRSIVFILRVVEMSGRCNDILLSSAKNKVSYFLQQALDELYIHLETACDKYHGEGECIVQSYKFVCERKREREQDRLIDRQNDIEVERECSME